VRRYTQAGVGSCLLVLGEKVCREKFPPDGNHHDIRLFMNVKRSNTIQ